MFSLRVSAKDIRIKPNRENRQDLADLVGLQIAKINFLQSGEAVFQASACKNGENNPHRKADQQIKQPITRHSDRHSFTDSEFPRDRIERGCQICADQRDSRNNGNRDQRSEKAIFNRGNALFGFNTKPTGDSFCDSMHCDPQIQSFPAIVVKSPSICEHSTSSYTLPMI